VIEELFHGISQRTRLPKPAEHLLKFREALDEQRPIDRTAQRAADERGARSAEAHDGMIGAVLSFDLGP
jgi:hypothetical protein